jgi:hypothetical protein
LSYPAHDLNALALVSKTSNGERINWQRSFYFKFTIDIGNSAYLGIHEYQIYKGEKLFGGGIYHHTLHNGSLCETNGGNKK